jgi:hypothetical protein
MKKSHKIALLIVLLTIQISVLVAQPGGPRGGPGGGDQQVGGGTGIPLDGGALELLLAGLAYIGFTKTKAWFNSKKKAEIS